MDDPKNDFQAVDVDLFFHSIGDDGQVDSFVLEKGIRQGFEGFRVHGGLKGFPLLLTCFLSLLITRGAIASLASSSRQPIQP